MGMIKFCKINLIKFDVFWHNDEMEKIVTYVISKLKPAN